MRPESNPPAALGLAERRIGALYLPRASKPAVDGELTSADHLLLVVNVVGLCLALLDAWADLGSWSAYACVALTSVMYLSHVSWRGTPLLTRLLIFGISAGLVELAADYWLVNVTRTLVYAPWGPFLVASPAYMPLSWAGILLSMGYVGWVVQRKHGFWKGVLVATLLSGAYVPLYEALAHYAGWWTYQDCPMWGPVPYYIIIGEALIGSLLVPALVFALRGNPWRSAVAGGAIGVWIGVAYYIGMAFS